MTSNSGHVLISSPFKALEPPLAGAHALGGMFGSSEAMLALFEQTERLGRTDAAVLISGETGTGKELVARALHDHSARRAKPFIALNCSVLPPEFVESELFGHVRGAFPSADTDQSGLFQVADGGTLFLDEIGDLSFTTQARLLRALESHEILRVGSTLVVRVDVRVIVATNRPLEELVEAGALREDLFSRLTSATLMIPPLRARRADIPELAHHFLQLQQMQDGVERHIDSAAMHALETYDWPGNVRELRNVLTSAIALAQDERTLGLRYLPSEFNRDTAPTEQLPSISSGGLLAIAPHVFTLPFAEARALALEEFDRAFLVAALQRHAGNIARTARSLGLHRQSLQKLMARRSIKAERPV